MTTRRQTSVAIERLERSFVDRVGISIAGGGHGPLIERFIAARMHELGLPSLDDYLARLLHTDATEFQRLVDAATVGLTWFFRDPDQLEAFAELLCGELRGRSLRVWVAGCSTGEEVYSLAMVAESLGADVRLLGTDVNEAVLARARVGRYSAWSARALPDSYRGWLAPTDDGGFEVAWTIRRRASFLRHSLVEPAPASGEGRHWDVIFCRNVLIYFHPARLMAALGHVTRALGHDGWLFLGASEMVMPAPGLRLVPVGRRHALRPALPATATVSPSPSPATLVRSSPPPGSAATATTASSPSVPSQPARSPDVAQRFSRAYARYSAGAFNEAMQQLADLLAQDPLFAEARLLLGMAYYRNGDLGDAIGALRAALFIAPELWAATFYLALCYEAAGDQAEAERHFRHVIASADRPLPRSAAVELRDELEAWKPDVIAIARHHLRNSVRID